MMMSGQIIAASRRNCLQLMVRQIVAEMSSGGSQSIVESISRVIHLISLEDFLQAPLIETAVVGHQGQIDCRPQFIVFPEKLHAHRFPYTREAICTVGIAGTEAVDLLTSPTVIIRFRMDQAVKAIDDFTVSDQDRSQTADAGAAFIGCFEIYCEKIFHLFVIFIKDIEKNLAILFEAKEKSVPLHLITNNAEIAQLVEHNLAKVRVASSSLVFRSREVFNF